MKFINTALVLFLTFMLSGCDPRTDGHGGAENGHSHHKDRVESEADASHPRILAAVAELHPTEGYEGHGTVTFTQVEDGILVSVDARGIPGPGKRGFHIHEHGDCSAPDATSAGGHFNPTDMPHGGRDNEHRHAGDFGNLTVDEDGNARTQFVDTHISFHGANSIIGRSVIIHAEEDDLHTQPTGDSGDRVACGVIKAQEWVD